MTLDYMPNRIPKDFKQLSRAAAEKESRKLTVEWIALELKVTSKHANAILYAEETKLRAGEPARIHIDCDTGIYHGWRAGRATALLGEQTQGGADNLHNRMHRGMGSGSWTTDELKELIKSLHPNKDEDQLESIYKQARNKDKRIITWYPLVQRWRAYGLPEPDITDFNPIVTGGDKHRSLVALYGDMPWLKHGSQAGGFKWEDSECIQWMMEKSGIDLDEAEKTWQNDFPYAWINTLKGERCSDRQLSQAVVVYDKATKTRGGINTALQWIKSLKSQPEKEETNGKKPRYPRPTGNMTPSSNEYLWSEEDFELYEDWQHWIGLKGEERKIPEAIWDKIRTMTYRRDTQAAAFLKDLFRGMRLNSISTGLLIDALVEEETWLKDGDGVRHIYEGEDSPVRQISDSKRPSRA